MKLRELMRLHEEVHSLNKVISLRDLKDEDGGYLAGTVNVAGYVNLVGEQLHRLPVQFGSIGGDFTCSRNQLTSLEGVPSSVGGGFYCSNNRLTSLEGAPGAVGRDFYCTRNRLTSLQGAHRILRRIGDMLDLEENPIERGGIGLVLVDGLKRIDADQPAFKIINKYLGQGMKGMLRCQEALHDAGFAEFAKL